MNSLSSRLSIVQQPYGFSYKDSLPLQPDLIWKIEVGVVRSLTWGEDGKVITLGFWGNGDVLGRPLSRLQPYQIECLTTVQVSKVSPESNYLQRALLTHTWKSEELISIIHQPSVADKLFQLLRWLSSQYGKPILHGTLLDLRLTHQLLAETIGSSRVSVTRILSQFEQDGKIQRSQCGLILCL